MKYLKFIKQLRNNKDSKTDIYLVINKDHQKLGEIHWKWRQYIMTYSGIVDMSRGCHLEINNFIDKLMQDRRVK